MKNSSLIQIVKFTLFSISAGIIETVFFTLFKEVFHFTYWMSYLPALLLSIIWNFTFNRRYTFKSAVNVPVAMAKLLGFYAVFTPVSTYLGHVAEASGANSYVIFAATMLSNLVLEYLFCKFVVFRNNENTLIEKKKGQ